MPKRRRRRDTQAGFFNNINVFDIRTVFQNGFDNSFEPFFRTALIIPSITSLWVYDSVATLGCAMTRLGLMTIFPFMDNCSDLTVFDMNSAIRSGL